MIGDGLSAASCPSDALATRAGRVRGRGYVHETDAAWELVEEAIEPFRSDLERRAVRMASYAAASVAIGTIAGLYRAREPEMGTVLAYAGEDASSELAAEVTAVEDDVDANEVAGAQLHAAASEPEQPPDDEEHEGGDGATVTVASLALPASERPALAAHPNAGRRWPARSRQRHLGRRHDRAQKGPRAS